MRKTLVIIAAVVAVSALVGCSSGGDGRECIEVPDEIMTRIADGANDTPITPIAAAGVQSKNFEDATIVAMSFDVAGVETRGAWAIAGTLDNPGATLAVDAVAASFTVWPNEILGKKLNTTEDGVTEARACLKSLG